MSIYQRGDNWYIDFYFKGQRIRKCIGPSRKGAEKVIAKRKAAIAENKFLDVRKDPEPVMFHEFAKEYLEWAKANKKLLSWKQDLYKMRRLDKKFGKRILQEITTLEIEKYKSRRSNDIGPAALNGELRLIKHLYSKAIEWEKAKENPARAVKLLKGEKSRVRFLSPDEVKTLLSNCVDHLEPIVTLALHSGMRKSEILGLQWSQVNFDQGIITVLDSKNHERRDIPMDQTVKAMLQENQRNGDYVFSDQTGNRFTSFQHSFETARKKSGIEDFHFHDLRHTFASHLVMQGIDIMTVKELMGHKTLDMTLRYAHLAPDHKTKAITILDRVFGKVETTNVIDLQEKMRWSQNPPHEEIAKKAISVSL